MKFKKSFSLMLSLSIFTVSCTANMNSIPKDNLVTSSNLVFGTVKLTVNPNSFSSFKIKSIDFVNSSIKKLKLEVKARDITTDISQTVDWTPGGLAATFSLNVPVGKNRILILSPLNENGEVVSSPLMGALDVALGNNNAKINPFETIIAQILLNLLESSSSTLDNVKIDDLRDYINNVSGYKEETNTFSKTDPLSLNPNVIANSISEGGDSTNIPTNLENISSLASVKINANVSGIKVQLTDLNSKEAVSDSNTVTINNVNFGSWKAIITKAGYYRLVKDIEVNSPNIEVNVNLNQDTSTSSMTEVTIPTVPDGSITIDGNANDWTGVNPVASDPQGDSTDQVDLKSLYMAKDSQFLYWRMETYSTPIINYPLGADNSGYTINFDNSTGKEMRVSNQEPIRARASTSLGNNSNDSEISGAINTVIEMRVPLNVYGSLTNQVLWGNFYNGSAIEDKTDKFKIVN